MDDNQCRVCLGEANGSRLSVFKRVNGISIEEKLRFVTGLEITKDDCFSKLLCTKCFNDTITSYSLKVKCLDTDRTLRNLERKFQTKLKEKVQEIFLQNDVKGNFMEIEQLEEPLVLKQETMSDHLIIEELVEDDQEIEELFVTEEVEEEVLPPPPESYLEVEVFEEYLDADAHEPQIEHFQEMESHPFTPLKRERYSCLLCKPHISFKNEIGLKIHEWDVHLMGSRNPLVCSTCGYTFENEKNKDELLARHMHKHYSAHASAKMNSCLLCPEVFKSPRHLEEHRNRYHLKQTTNRCKGCQSEFQTNHDLQAHLATSDCRDIHERPFKCYICNEMFSMGIAKKKHIQTDHQDKAGADCPLCLRCKIPSAVAFENHYKTHFAQPRFCCSFCGRPFYESDRLATHIRRAHENTKLSCNWCEKTFRDKSGIARHILGVHFNQRNHRCDVCSKAFTASYNLKEHMFSVHKSASKFYTCESCSQVFLYRKQFERHRNACSGVPEKRRR